MAKGGDLAEQLAEQLADVEPVEPNGSKPAGGKKRGSGDQAEAKGPGKRRRSKVNTSEANAEVARLSAEAAARAEAEAAEIVGERPKPKPKPDTPPMSKADKQRIRRAGRRPVAVELEAAEGAMLDVLTELHGSQRAALGLAVRALYDIEQGEQR